MKARVDLGHRQSGRCDFSLNTRYHGCHDDYQLVFFLFSPRFPVTHNRDPARDPRKFGDSDHNDFQAVFS